MDTATLVIRLIRSFAHHNVRNIVLKEVSLSITTEELSALITESLPTAPNLPPPFRKFNYDTLKIEHLAHGAKTNDPVINCENDDQLILKKGKTLKDSGIHNETEISFFNYDDYKSYKENPVHTWVAR